MAEELDAVKLISGTEGPPDAATKSILPRLDRLQATLDLALDQRAAHERETSLLRAEIDAARSETSLRSAELAMISSVQRALAEQLDMQGVVDLVGENIRQLFKAESTLVALVDHD